MAQEHQNVCDTRREITFFKLSEKIGSPKFAQKPLFVNLWLLKKAKRSF